MLKIFFGYIGMIGVTLLGLIGVLRLGSAIEAPASVKGTWEFRVSGPDTAVQCTGLTGWIRNPELQISQSGPDLTIHFHNTSEITLTGKVQDLSITAALENPEIGNTQMMLSLQLNRSHQPDKLQGLLRMPNCVDSVQLVGTKVQ